MPPNASLTYCSSLPTTVNTTYGEPSFTVTAAIVIARSSLANVPVSAAKTTLVLGCAIVTGTPATGFALVYKVPVPSSLIVAVAVTFPPDVTPPVVPL